MWKEYRVLVGLVISIVVATTGAVLYFTPMGYAEKTRDMIVEISLKEQLNYYQDRLWELEKACTDLQVEGSWFCSPEKKHSYEQYLIEIEILKAKLGIGG